MGLVTVSNPEWDGTAGSPRTIQRDYRFGALNGGAGYVNGTVELEAANGTRTVLPVNSWNNNTINANVPVGFAPGEYQVVVTRSHLPPLVEHPLAESPIGATLTVGAGSETVIRVPSDFPTIQAAIDAADPGDLILVAPGVYDELVIMWKPVKLQGSGAGVVTINARQVPAEKINDWRTRVTELTDGNPANGEITPLPGQTFAPTGFPALDPPIFPTEEGAGIFVAGLDTGPGSFASNPGARIDGFTILGASTGGGIVVNGYAEGLVIANNRLSGNSGIYSGAIRLGHPQLSHQEGDILVYDDSANDGIRIHHNHIAKNGGGGGAGGGISLHTGADNYAVQKNWICGNFTTGSGGGIGQLGLADNGLIEDNYILFNESFDQGTAQRGGGIFIGGEPALQANGAGLLLTPGSGSVVVDANIIRGNMGGAGDGGGIALANVNGDDVSQNPADTGPWYSVDVFNNMIDNNVTGLAGGGISIQDALKVTIRNDTVANNDSTATANVGGAFPVGQVNRSEPQPAGIISRVHSPDLALAMGDVTASIPTDWLSFSDPTLRGSIVLHNRSFYWLNFNDPATPQTETGLFPATCPFNNLTDPQCDVATATLANYLAGPGGDGRGVRARHLRACAGVLHAHPSHAVFGHQQGSDCTRR